MSKTNLSSLSIDGLGSYPGGDYDKVSIAGIGKIQDDVTCNFFDVSGKGKLLGNVHAGYFEVSGMCTCNKAVTADHMQISGTISCKETVNVGEIHMEGMMSVNDNINAKIIRCCGTITGKGNITAEQVEVEGSLQITGALNCEEFKIKLAGTSEIVEFGGSICVVRAPLENRNVIAKLFMPARFRNDCFVCNTIEADQITIENSKVNKVRGEKVVIGKGCIIDTVEYSESIHIDESAVVKYVVQK